MVVCFLDSGFADRIYELMSVSRELRIAGGNEMVQKKDTGSYFIEAPYIEFEGVRVSTETWICNLETVNSCSL
jgi:hypothetical protein